MALREIKIKFINRKPKVWTKGKNKDGKYILVGLKIEGFDEWINGIGDALNEKWKVGTEVELDITKKTLDDGRVFYNFKNPSAKDTLADVIERLEILENIIKVGNIIGNGETIHQANGGSQDDDEGNLPI